MTKSWTKLIFASFLATLGILAGLWFRDRRPSDRAPVTSGPVAPLSGEGVVAAADPQAARRPVPLPATSASHPVESAPADQAGDTGLPSEVSEFVRAQFERTRWMFATQALEAQSETENSAEAVHRELTALYLSELYRAAIDGLEHGNGVELVHERDLHERIAHLRGVDSDFLATSVRYQGNDEHSVLVVVDFSDHPSLRIRREDMREAYRGAVWEAANQFNSMTVEARLRLMVDHRVDQRIEVYDRDRVLARPVGM